MSSIKRKIARKDFPSDVLYPETGAYYSIRHEKQYNLIKVLDVTYTWDGELYRIHTCVYFHLFDKRPFGISASGLYLEPAGEAMTPNAIMQRMHAAKDTDRHRIFTLEGFLMREPVFIAPGTLTKEELREYRYYTDYDEEGDYIGHWFGRSLDD